MELFLKTMATIIYGTLMLRIAGRKSIAQMTIAQTVVMLAIGTVLIEPLVGTVLLNTFFVVGIAVATLIIIEYSEIKFTTLKKVFTGEPVLLIENGMINRNNLKRVRMTIQQLEMELRQASIPNVSEVMWATIEPNGQFGFILKEEFQPISKREYRELLCRLTVIEKSLGIKSEYLPETSNAINNEKNRDTDVFEKVFRNETHG